MNQATSSNPAVASRPSRKVLVLDDSLMLLSFVKDTLTQGNYEVEARPTAAAGLLAAKADPPNLILLDYALPDMRGDEVSRQLLQDPKTAQIPVVFMSGLGAKVRPNGQDHANVIGFLNKPFTSDLLIKTVETHMPKSPDEPQPEGGELQPLDSGESMESGGPTGAGEAPAPATEPAPAESEWWSAPQPQATWAEPAAPAPAPSPAPAAEEQTTNEFPPLAAAPISTFEEGDLPDESVTGAAFFSGDTRFFSVNWALRTIAKEKLTGTLRSFWSKEPVDLLAQNGQIVLVTSHDAALYCAESPITLVNVDPARIDAARAQQRETGGPMFLSLAQENLILREPATQLVQHYGQKLFAQLWTAPRVRFVFEKRDALPAYANDLPMESDVDNWTLATLRFIQFQDLGSQAGYDPASIPAYTKDGFDRVQELRLTVAEAQFASQFNGSRSIQQIAKNLRLDLKFARLTLFRFLALEIVECWSPTTTAKPERKGVFQRITRSIVGD